MRVRVYPISVDVAEFEEAARSEAVRREEARLFAERPERIVLRVDRTDPSKNIVRGFQAFGLFLDQHPEWRGRVRLLALLDPSRLDIPEYAEYLAGSSERPRRGGATPRRGRYVRRRPAHSR